MAAMVSFDVVPREPSSTDTFAIVRSSGASTTLTKSYSPSVAHWFRTFTPSCSTSRFTSGTRPGLSLMVLTPLGVSFVSMMKTAIYSSSSWLRGPGLARAWPEPTFVYAPKEGKGDSREETGARQAEGLDAAADRPRDRGADRCRVPVRGAARRAGGRRCGRRGDPRPRRESALRRAHRGRLGATGPLRDARGPRSSPGG